MFSWNLNSAFGFYWDLDLLHFRFMPSLYLIGITVPFATSKVGGGRGIKRVGGILTTLPLVRQMDYSSGLTNKTHTKINSTLVPRKRERESENFYVLLSSLHSRTPLPVLLVLLVLCPRQTHRTLVNICINSVFSLSRSLDICLALDRHSCQLYVWVCRGVCRDMCALWLQSRSGHLMSPIPLLSPSPSPSASVVPNDFY